MWGRFGFLQALVCRGKLLNTVLVFLVALQDLSLQGQGGGGCDSGAESSGGSADRQDHCQRVFAFLPAQGKRSVRAAALAGPAVMPQLLCSTPQRPQTLENEPCAEAGCITSCHRSQLLLLVRAPGVGNCPITPVFRGFSTRLSLFNPAPPGSPVITGSSCSHTKTRLFF